MRKQPAINKPYWWVIERQQFQPYGVLAVQRIHEDGLPGVTLRAKPGQTLGP